MLTYFDVEQKGKKGKRGRLEEKAERERGGIKIENMREKGETVRNPQKQ